MTIQRFTKQQRWWTKDAEVSGTALMPNQPPSNKTKGKEKAVVKTAMTPHIDVSASSSPREVRTVQHEHFAMPSLQRYPLDSYEEVKTASAYFDEWGNVMDPQHRREYCQNLTKRAFSLGIEVSPKVARYGASGYSEDVDAMLEARRSLLVDGDNLSQLNKLAEVRPLLPADVFCAALAELDKETGLDRSWGTRIPDPYYSTFGEKTAEKAQLVMVGTESVPTRAIVNASKTHMKSIASTFGDELAEEFRKDPMSIFSSLPRDQKKMIMRMVSDNSPNPDTTGSI